MRIPARRTDNVFRFSCLCPIGWALLLALLGGGAALAAPEGESSTARLKALSIEDLMRVQVATVTTASRQEESAPDAPATVIVIDRRQIERRGYITLADVLRDVPGMDVIPYYFSEVGTLVAVRGISGNNKVVVLINGMRVNPPGGEYYPLRTDLSVREAEQVEIIYGPGSTLYGEDAIAAVINIVTRQPDKTSGEVAGGVGPNDTWTGWGTFGGAIGEHAENRLMGHVFYSTSHLTPLDRHYPDWWQAYEDVATPKGSGVTPDRVDEGLNVVARAETPGAYVQVFQRWSQRSSSEGFSTILGYVPEARWEDMSTVIEANNDMFISEEARLGSKLTYSRYEVDPQTRYVFPKDTQTWFLDDYKYALGQGTTLEESLHLNPHRDVKILAGVAASTFNIRPKSTVPGGAHTGGGISAQAGNFVYFTSPGDASTRHEIPRSGTENYETYAGYVEGAWQMLPAWKSILGVRVTDDTRLDEQPVTPRAALVYSISENLTAKYVFTRAYTAPAPYFGSATYDNGTVLNAANPDLEAETASTHEINLTYAEDGRNLGLSVYAGSQDNLLQIADSGLPQTIIQDTVYLEDGSTRSLGHAVNGGDSETIGADIYGELQMRRLSPWFSISVVDYHGDQSADRLPGLSQVNGRLGVTWAALDRLLITPSAVVRSKPQNVHAGELGSELENPWELGLNVLYRIRDSTEFFLNLRNITDHEYALGSISGDAAPQETFHGMAGVEVRF